MSRLMQALSVCQVWHSCARKLPTGLGQLLLDVDAGCCMTIRLITMMLLTRSLQE